MSGVLAGKSWLCKQPEPCAGRPHLADQVLDLLVSAAAGRVADGLRQHTQVAVSGEQQWHARAAAVAATEPGTPLATVTATHTAQHERSGAAAAAVQTDEPAMPAAAHPGRLLLDVKLGGGQQVDERRHNARVHNSLRAGARFGGVVAPGSRFCSKPVSSFAAHPSHRPCAARQSPHSPPLTWICSLVPAVMLEMVQHASFLMLFLWLVVSRLSRQGRAPQLMMICAERRAGT